MAPHTAFSCRGNHYPVILAAMALFSFPLFANAAQRPVVWIDACEGEPAEYADIVEDLGKARVVYLGERHTLQRHHATQARLIADLAGHHVPMVGGGCVSCSCVAAAVGTMYPWSVSKP